MPFSDTAIEELQERVARSYHATGVIDAINEPYEIGRLSVVAGIVLATFVASRPSCPKGAERYSEKYSPCPVAICAQSKEHSDGTVWLYHSRVIGLSV